jgi:hypothetical protein
VIVSRHQDVRKNISRSLSVLPLFAGNARAGTMTAPELRNVTLAAVFGVVKDYFDGQSACAHPPNSSVVAICNAITSFDLVFSSASTKNLQAWLELPF